MGYKITYVNRGVLLTVLLITGVAYACMKANYVFLHAFVIYVVGTIVLESWKIWLGFGVFRRLSGKNVIGIIYVLSIVLSFVPLLGWIACAVANDMAGKAVAQRLGRKPSCWVYFGWLGLYHLQGLLNEGVCPDKRNDVQQPDRQSVIGIGLDEPIEVSPGKFQTAGDLTNNAVSPGEFDQKLSSEASNNPELAKILEEKFGWSNGKPASTPVVQQIVDGLVK